MPPVSKTMAGKKSRFSYLYQTLACAIKISKQWPEGRNIPFSTFISEVRRNATTTGSHIGAKMDSCVENCLLRACEHPELFDVDPAGRTVEITALGRRTFQYITDEVEQCEAGLDDVFASFRVLKINLAPLKTLTRTEMSNVIRQLRRRCLEIPHPASTIEVLPTAPKSGRLDLLEQEKVKLYGPSIFRTLTCNRLTQQVGASGAIPHNMQASSHIGRQTEVSQPQQHPPQNSIHHYRTPLDPDFQAEIASIQKPLHHISDQCLKLGERIDDLIRHDCWALEFEEKLWALGRRIGKMQ
ncbi:hypothetical protein DFH06DRAFT_1149723 [Mycena polygramma]|nr:hypothetical protein DFH06DRAFT_1149723 [Mycena polygramma]